MQPADIYASKQPRAAWPGTPWTFVEKRGLLCLIKALSTKGLLQVPEFCGNAQASSHSKQCSTESWC